MTSSFRWDEISEYLGESKAKIVIFLRNLQFHPLKINDLFVFDGPHWKEHQQYQPLLYQMILQDHLARPPFHWDIKPSKGCADK